MITQGDTLSQDHRNSGSFRDPSGFLFVSQGILYRQINRCYQNDYERLMSSGLYKKLTHKKWLIPHQEVTVPFWTEKDGYKVIQPERVPFISYPYEWSFSQLKDAALTTLAIQKAAFQKGMSLKDASAYNIQFVKGKAVFIDTLSFETYQEGLPWVAYGQFCRHFLAPLALMSYTDIRLNQLSRLYLDGIPLDLAASLLPFSSRFNMSLYMHLFMHSKSQKKHEGDTTSLQKKKPHVSKLGFQGIIESLEKTIKKLSWQPEGTEWGDYYNDTNYSSASLTQKEEIIKGYITQCKPAHAWDLGANDGRFSLLACAQHIPTVAFDIDPCAVEKNYLRNLQQQEERMLPLIIDLTNPSPGLGWAHHERDSFMERGPVDLIMALALIHHLAISNNVPFCKIAAFLAALCQHLIIEFVPKDDSQVQRLLATREDVFPDYTQKAFETEFSAYFSIEAATAIPNTVRTLYLLKKKV